MPYLAVFFSILINFFTLGLVKGSALAATENPLSAPDINMSAYIAEQSITTNPVLITPHQDSVTRNRFEQFSWYKAVSSNGINHYELYLDGIKLFDDIYDLTSRDTSSFISLVTTDKVSLTSKIPMSEGKHTWMIKAVSNGEITGDSETWSFTVDTTIPIIILQAVDKNVMYWATNDPATIPAYDQRHLIVGTKDPLFSGKVEANANLKLTLVCPSSALSKGCVDQVITILDTDGNWQHRFYNLLKNITYTAYFSATDAAGNSNYFPEFTVTFKPKRLIPLPFTPTPTGMPTITGVPPSSPSIEPQIPGESPFERGEPFRVAPPPPPFIEKEVLAITPATSYQLLTTICYWGLLLHLTMTVIGSHIPLLVTLRFLFLLLFPFLGKKNGITFSQSRLLPFTTIHCYSPDTSPKHIKTIVSDILGRFAFPQIEMIFTKATHPDYNEFSQLINVLTPTTNNLLPNQLPLIKRSSQTLSDTFSKILMTTRIIPLVIALLTGFYALFLASIISWTLILFVCLSVGYFFSEYIYPRLTR